MSENEKMAAVKECARLVAEYRRTLIEEGVPDKQATDMASYSSTMILSSKGVIKFDDDEDKPWEKPK